MRISIVLATYNGEKYIVEQLESIIHQSRCPDEIIVMDDHSTDSTVEIVRNILDTIPDITTKLIINKENKGWRKNFIDGFHKASGDLIFCADQDDIWTINKLELMEQVMINNPDINVLACNLVPLYESNATKLADFYIQNYGTGYIERVNMLNNGFTVLRPGCTICFRNIIIPWVDSVWTPKLAHDEVLWAVGVVTKSLFIVNEPLIHFRRHGSNNSPSNAKRIKPRLERAECELLKINGIVNNSSFFHVDEEYAEYLRVLKVFDEMRIQAFTERNMVKGLRLLRMKENYTSIKAWVADMICILRG